MSVIKDTFVQGTKQEVVDVKIPAREVRRITDETIRAVVGLPYGDLYINIDGVLCCEKDCLRVATELDRAALMIINKII